MPLFILYFPKIYSQPQVYVSMWRETPVFFSKPRGENRMDWAPVSAVATHDTRTNRLPSRLASKDKSDKDWFTREYKYNVTVPKSIC